MKKCRVGDICLHIGVVNAGKLIEIVGEPSLLFATEYPDGSVCFPADPKTDWQVVVCNGFGINQNNEYVKYGVCADALLMPLRPDTEKELETEKELTQ
jgi:hypothetical protein